MSDFLQEFVFLWTSFLPPETKKQHLKICPHQPVLLGKSVCLHVKQDLFFSGLISKTFTSKAQNIYGTFMEDASDLPSNLHCQVHVSDFTQPC